MSVQKNEIKDTLIITLVVVGVLGYGEDKSEISRPVYIKSKLFIWYFCVSGRSICILFIQNRPEYYLNTFTADDGDGRYKNGSNKTTELHDDPLKKSPTSNMGMYSHHSLERSKSIVAETSNRGVGGVDFGVRHRV